MTAVDWDSNLNTYILIASYSNILRKRELEISKTSREE